MFNISPDVIILGVVAGAVLYKLYSILGQKDEDGSITTIPLKKEGFLAEVVDISAMVKEIDEPVESLVSEEENNLAKGFEAVVAEIKSIDPKFLLQRFFDGAKAAFEMILTAFATDDRATLKDLLGSATYKQFISEIDKRLKNGVALEFILVSVPKVEIKNITLANNVVAIEILFESQQINILRNKKGDIVEGSLADVDNMEDIWTFAKDLQGKQNWQLVKVNAA